jgi:mRNA interferase MazF
VVARGYVPEAGDVVWLDFSPQAGHEQSGRRPAVVLSPASYNRRAGLAVVCPLTRQQKGYPFEVALPSNFPLAGVILADHLRSVDWRARRAERAGRAPAAVMEEVREKIGPLLGLT